MGKKIQKLSDLDVVRKNPGIYGGSDDINGTIQTFKEVLNNTVDLYLENPGYNTIDVEYNPDTNVYSIQDYGMGLPVGWNETEQDYDYNLVLFTLNAGSNYENNQKKQISLGKFGIGLSYSIMSSEKAQVIVVKEGVKYTLDIESGTLKNIEEEKTEQQSGTMVKIKPSNEVFTDINIPEKWLTEYLYEQTVTNKGFKINYKNTDTGEEDVFHHENGIDDYIKELSDGKEFTDFVNFESDTLSGKDADNRDEYDSQYNVAYTFNNDNYGSTVFHNSSKLTEESSQHKSIRLAFSYAIDKMINRLGLYNKKESKIKFEDVEDSLLIIINTYSTNTSYKNQTKKGINNLDIQRKLNELLRNSLQVFFTENPLEAEKVVTQVLANKRSREKADRTRIDVRKQLSKKKNTIASKIEGYYPPKSKKKEERILAICEGKSALSSMLDGRDVNTYGIYPIRGKTLNTYKASEKQIASNELITDLYSILGCGMELSGKRGSKANNFDIDNLNFDKIAIFADADEDGIGSIMPLLLVMFERLSPQLLEEGKIYYGQTPKYEVKTLDEELYAFNDNAFEEIKKKIGNKKYEVNFVKGLGELNQNGISQCMRPEAENLLQIQVEKDESVDILKMFMGKDVSKRREIILDSFKEDN